MMTLSEETEALARRLAALHDRPVDDTIPLIDLKGDDVAATDIRSCLPQPE